jgi:hypothetical protein
MANKKLNKFNLGEEIFIPVKVVGIKLWNGRVYYTLETNTNSNVIFKIYDPDRKIYPKGNFDRDDLARTVTIVEDDLIKISSRP